jgi:myo-inositol-1(or 4)-monophosphatase
MPDALQVARAAALAGGRVLSERAGSLLEIRTKSSASDFVTDVDIAAGVAAASEIAASWPGARFVIEESEVYETPGVTQGDLGDSEVWVIDPLDGTTSYMHRYPCFSASAGGGATLDGRALRCTGTDTIEHSLLITGFPYDRTVTLDRQLAILTRMLRTVHGIRRDGSAAIDCCHVAAARADGYWELGLKPWDVAAGALIVREAGGIITDFDGHDWTTATTDVVVAGPALHPVLLAAVQERASQ